MKLIMIILGLVFGVFTKTAAIGSTPQVETFEGCIQKHNSIFRMTVQRQEQETEDSFQVALLELSQEIEGAGFKVLHIDMKSGIFILQTLDPILAEKYATQQIANGSRTFQGCHFEGIFQ